MHFNEKFLGLANRTFVLAEWLSNDQSRCFALLRSGRLPDGLC